MNIEIFISQNLIWFCVGMALAKIVRSIKQHIEDEKERKNYKDDDDGTNGWNRW